MKEELSQKLIESLDKVQEYVESTGEFVIEQAPLVAQEIICLGRAESMFGAVVSTLIFIVSVSLLTFGMKKLCKCEANSTSSEGYAAMSIVSFVISVISFFTTCHYIVETFEPWFAPRVYLLHEISKLL